MTSDGTLRLRALATRGLPQADACDPSGSLRETGSRSSTDAPRAETKRTREVFLTQ